MPYSLCKLNDGYNVYNEITNKRYSKHPQTLEKAKAQLRILKQVGGYIETVYLTEAPNPKYKYLVNYKNKNILFGASGYSDFILSGGDEKKKKAYIARHKINEDWNDLSKKGTWSRYILWNKKTLKDSINDMNKRFNINIIYI
mgnify:FL=1